MQYWLIYLTLGVVVWILIREINCWYWKINAALDEMQEIKNLMVQLVDSNLRMAKALEDDEGEQADTTDVVPPTMPLEPPLPGETSVRDYLLK